MQEIFKDIQGYEGVYQVSNLGNVKSYKNKDGKILIPSPNNYGYQRVGLRCNNRKLCSVHRLVAEAFISNPENKKEVNHINGIKTDNRVQNLEWSTHSENIIHAHKTGLIKAHNKRGKDWPLSKPVNQLTLDGKFIAKHTSGKEAAMHLGSHAATISNCCKGKGKTASGFKWEFSI